MSDTIVIRCSRRVAAVVAFVFIAMLFLLNNYQQVKPNVLSANNLRESANDTDVDQSPVIVKGWQWKTSDLYDYKKNNFVSVAKVDPSRLAPLTHEAQKFIFEWQFRSEEECQKANFLLPPEHYAGLGSIIHVQGAWLAAAIENGRIMLSPQAHHSYLAGNPYCTKFWGCLFEDVTNCSAFARPENTASLADLRPIVGGIYPTVLMNQLKAARPDIEVHRHCLKYWWRAQSTAFMRPTAAALEMIHELRKADKTHPWPLGNGIMFVFIRRGNKGSEMTLPPLDAYMSAADHLAYNHPLYIRRWMMIASDSHKAILDFNQTIPAGWTSMVLDMPRTDDIDGGANNDINSGISSQLGGDIVHRHLLQIYLALEADAWVCTLQSNMCRIIDELRCTWIPKCENPYIDTGVGDSWKEYEW